MRVFFARIAGLLLLVLVPVMLTTSGLAAAVNVFPACSDPSFQKAHTDVCSNVGNPGTPGQNPIIKALKVTITILSVIIGFVAVIMLIVAGLSFITANGDAQAVAKARGTIIFALVGLVIAAMAQSIVVFVLNKL